MKKNVEIFLKNFPSFKILKNWHIDELLLVKKTEWEYYLEEEKSYSILEKTDEIPTSKRRRKWLLLGEKQIDYSEGVF